MNENSSFCCKKSGVGVAQTTVTVWMSTLMCEGKVNVGCLEVEVRTDSIKTLRYSFANNRQTYPSVLESVDNSDDYWRVGIWCY